MHNLKERILFSKYFPKKVDLAQDVLGDVLGECI